MKQKLEANDMEKMNHQDYKKYVQMENQINQLYEEYQFLDFSYAEFFKLIQRLIEKNSSEYEKEKPESMKQFLQNCLEQELKIWMKDEQKAKNIIQKYIQFHFPKANNIEEDMSKLKKIQFFFHKMNYHPTVDTYIQILETNEQINKIFSFIVKINMGRIKKEELGKIFKEPIIRSFVTTYCMINDIEIKEETEEIKPPFYDGYKEDSTTMYLSEIGKFSILTKEEEIQLFHSYNSGNLSAKQEIIHKNLKLVVSIAKRYYNLTVPLLDLIQEGNIGLIAAIDRFDITKGYKFSTYATWWIRQAVERAASQKGRNVRLPVHMYNKVKEYRKVFSILENSLNREPTIAEMADKLEITIEEASKLCQLQLDTVSFNMPLKEDSETELGECIPASDITMEEEYVDKSIKSDMLKLLKESNLTERETDVIIKYFGLEDGNAMTLEQIGKIYGVTRERIRQNMSKALGKLRNNPKVRELAGKKSQIEEDTTYENHKDYQKTKK